MSAAWDRVCRVVMSTLCDTEPVEWTVEELGNTDQPGVRVFRYAYRRRRVAGASGLGPDTPVQSDPLG